MATTSKTVATQQRQKAVPGSKAGFAVPSPAKPQTPSPEIRSLDEDDPIDRASYDSFPASDPPAHSAERAEPGGKRGKS